MTNEIQIHKEELPVLMKTGLVHWLPKELHDKFRNALRGQTGHTFVDIPKLGISINTAEVSEACTIAEYDDLVKVKQGMYQCSYRKWHAKREECFCQREANKRIQDEMNRIRNEADNKPMTDEQRAMAAQKFAEIREHLRQIGVLKKKEEKMSFTPEGRAEYERLTGKPYQS